MKNMQVVRLARWFIICLNIGVYESSASDFCSPLVIAHRGASGYVPEHTLGAYALAITLEADYIEPDLVITRDGHLVCRHENELSLSTDVEHHSEFADRKRTQLVDGSAVTGWFVEDFTVDEIKTLSANELAPDIRPGNARLNGAFTIPTFQEIIDLVKSMEISQKRIIGICPEIKHGTYFSSIGRPMEQLVVDIFHQNGYTGPQAPAFIQSFEVSNLKQLKQLTDLRLLQLLHSNKTRQPYDQVVLGSTLTYEDMATPEGLKEVATYAYAVGPAKDYIIPRDNMNLLTNATSFVKDAHEAGLEVHPFTFRAENSYLPNEYRSSDPSVDAIGDLEGELRDFLAAGIDGVFSDQPDIPLRLRDSCVSEVPSAGNNGVKCHSGISLYSFITMIIVVSLFTNLNIIV